MNSVLGAQPLAGTISSRDFSVDNVGMKFASGYQNTDYFKLRRTDEGLQQRQDSQYRLDGA
jgi:hypothetical protein